MANNDLEYEYGRPRNRDLRASDRDREAVSAILRREHVLGRLTPDEFHERLDRCLRAKTYSELDELIADFPHEPESPRRPSLRPASFMFVPVALIALIAFSGGRIGWFGVPLFLFFVVRPRVWHSRGRRGAWGPPPLAPRSNRAQPYS